MAFRLLFNIYSKVKSRSPSAIAEGATMLFRLGDPRSITIALCSSFSKRNGAVKRKWNTVSRRRSWCLRCQRIYWDRSLAKTYPLSPPPLRPSVHPPGRTLSGLVQWSIASLLCPPLLCFSQRFRLHPVGLVSRCGLQTSQPWKITVLLIIHNTVGEWEKYHAFL